jgi:hypothetical protein
MAFHFSFSAWEILLPTPEKRCYVTLTIRRQRVAGRLTDREDGGRTFEITADENDTVEGLKQRILLELGHHGEIVKLTHRLKVLSDHKTLKQEMLEGGEVLDVVMSKRTLSSSGSFGGPIADAAEFNMGPSPDYF